MNNKVVTPEIRERMKALITKGKTNKEIADILNIKLGTVSYHSCRLRKNGNGKKPIQIDSLAFKEKMLSETFFGETIAGFFVHEGRLYCVMESGMALIVSGAESVSKENVDQIKKKMKHELEEMKRRIDLFEDWKK